MDGLRGKRAVLTGPGAGFSGAASPLFAGEGAQIIATDVIPSSIESPPGEANAEAHFVDGGFAL